MNDPASQKDLRAERLSRLIHTNPERARHNPLYSRLVKALRFLLPAVAMVIVAIVMAWPKMEQAVLPLTADSIARNPQPVTQNELINPRFEGADSQNQPYVVTAARAVQSAQNPDMLLLTDPRGDITLAGGDKLAITASKGTYRQNAGKLTLDGQVKLEHGNGYVMDTERLMVNIKTRETRTDQAVKIVGPGGTLDATGLDAQSAEGLIVFTGPAKLILNDSIKGL